MTPEQKTKLQEVIQNDCDINCLYCNSQGETCAIGAMFLAAGKTKDDLRAIPMAHSVWGSIAQVSVIKLEQELIDLLVITFGLGRTALCEIQCLNDSRCTPEARQEAILAYINTIPCASNS